MAKFEIDNLEGPLTYVITGANDEWKITRDSKNDDSDEHALETVGIGGRAGCSYHHGHCECLERPNIRPRGLGLLLPTD